MTQATTTLTRADLAEDYGLAIVGITHVNKGTVGKSPIDRVTGSLAFAAVPRIVLMTALVEGTGTGDNNPPQGVLVRAKSNIGRTDGGVLYEICQTQVPATNFPFASTSQIVWKKSVLGSAKEILKWAAKGGDAAVEESEAVAFYRSLLANGKVSVQTAQSEAENARNAGQAGLTDWALRCARKTLDVQTTREIFLNGEVANCWSLPEHGNGQSMRSGSMAPGVMALNAGPTGFVAVPPMVSGLFNSVSAPSFERWTRELQTPQAPQAPQAPQVPQVAQPQVDDLDDNPLIWRDQDGYDQEGFDRNGFDRGGYDAFGYDRYGYNSEGYDCDGLDYDSRDRNGQLHVEDESGND